MKMLIVTTALLSVMSSAVVAQLLDDNEVFKSYLTTPENAPVIDGTISLNEWNAAGPPIVVNSMTRPGAINGENLEPYGGDEDYSYQFRSLWVAPWDLYFLVEATDDVAMDDAHNLADRAWERDQIELLIDGDQLAGGNIRWWNGGEVPPLDEQYSQIETYGKFGVARNNDFEGNGAVMNADPEQVGLNGVVGSGVATETGENANYFVEYHISMLEAFNNGLFEGTDAGAFGTMIPELTAIKFQLSISDNDNVGDSTVGVRSHGGALSRGNVAEGPDEWWRSDAFPNLLMSDMYVPDVGGTDCDFDDNGRCDIGDLNALMYTGLVSGDLKYDLDSSGAIDLRDRDAFLREVGSLPGDANLDGADNAQDLNAVGSNWQATGITSYADGDFNGDGTSNAADLNELGIWWTKTAADFSNPQAAAASAVPEPATGWMIAVVSLLGMLRLRRRA